MATISNGFPLSTGIVTASDANRAPPTTNGPTALPDCTTEKRVKMLAIRSHDAQRSAALERPRTRSVAKQEAMDIASKQATLWECIRCYPDILGGKIYEFRSRENYRIPDGLPFDEQERLCNQIASKSISNFPAVERVDEEIENAFAKIKDISRLGYALRVEADRSILSLPDRVALKQRYELLRSERPDLPALTIKESTGRAPDMELIEAYIAGYDMLLSSGQEFVHDHLVHCLSVLSLLISSPKFFLESRQKLVACVQNSYKKIQTVEEAIKRQEPILDEGELEKAKAILAAVVDALWAQTLDISMDTIESVEKATTQAPYVFSDIWDMPTYKKYWIQRYKDEEPSKKVRDIWTKIMTYTAPHPWMQKVRSLLGRFCRVIDCFQ